MSSAAETVTGIIVEVWSQDTTVASTSTPYVASILAVATVASILMAEFRRRAASAPTAESAYTENFGKGIGIAAAIVLSLVSAGILAFEPAAAGVLVAWVGFGALAAACSVLPATPAELRELKSKGVYGLYWMPVLFAGSLFAVTFFVAR